VGKRDSRKSRLSSWIARSASITRQKRVNSAILHMIVKDLQPFSVVDDEGFRSLLRIPSIIIPSRTTLSRHHLVEAYDDVIIHLKARLADIDALGLTTNSWTSRSTQNW